MNTEPKLILVTALVRPHMEGNVVNALHELPEFPGFSITEVRGQGHGRGAGGSYQATEFDLTYHRFLQLQIVCRSDAADKICRTIAEAAWTGRKGDGVIFTTDAHSLVRIREAGGPGDEVL
jgi:nitrogen regulatory protein PII